LANPKSSAKELEGERRSYIGPSIFSPTTAIVFPLQDKRVGSSLSPSLKIDCLKWKCYPILQTNVGEIKGGRRKFGIEIEKKKEKMVLATILKCFYRAVSLPASKN
jgi:hypothetical protein